jgi:hypothetical protein
VYISWRFGLALSWIATGGEHGLPFDDVSLVVKSDKTAQEAVTEMSGGNPKRPREIDEDNSAVRASEDIPVGSRVEMKKTELGEAFHRGTELAEVVLAPVIDVVGEPEGDPLDLFHRQRVAVDAADECGEPGPP